MSAPKDTAPTYKSRKADPVRVRLSARSALHFECVVVGVFCAVFGAEVVDSVKEEDEEEREIVSL